MEVCCNEVTIAPQLRIASVICQGLKGFLEKFPTMDVEESLIETL